MAKYDKTTNTSGAGFIDIPTVGDPRGDLSFVQTGQCCPFAIERVYWIYDIPASRQRLGRALRHTDEFIIPLSGTFDVILDDGVQRRVYHLDRTYRGLYVPAGTWRIMDNFVTNSVAVVLASTLYDPADYISDYDQFLDETIHDD